MAQVYRFTDANGEVRLMAEIDPAPGGSLPANVPAGTVQGIIASAGLPNATISAEVGDAPNLGAVSLFIESDDAGGAAVTVRDLGTKDGIVSVSTVGGIYAQPRSDASPTGAIVEVTDTAGNDVLVVENDGKLGLFGHAPAGQQTGVAVNAAAIHAALVTLGLITA